MTRTLASGLRLFLAAVVLRTITDWSLPASIVVIGLSTLAYTYFGGIKAVVWIDVLQFAVYLVAAAVALGILLGEVPGGWEEIWRRGSAAGKFRVINFGFDGVAPGPDRSGEAGPGVLRDAHPDVHLLGRPDRRPGARHRDPRGRPDDGPART